MAEIAVREHQTHRGYPAKVLAAEVDDRTERRRVRRINKAKFPRIKRLAEFNIDAVPSIKPATLAHLAARNYLDAGEPVVILGDSGTGKTHLLIGLGLAACEQGRRVRYVTTARLVNELVEAADERDLSRVAARYGRLDLLCLDELGYVQIDPRGAELLFQIIAEREERASIAIATQPALQRVGRRVPRPPDRRRDRRSGHLQRPHPRDRHPVLPATHQQEHPPQGQLTRSRRGRAGRDRAFGSSADRSPSSTCPRHAQDVRRTSLAAAAALVGEPVALLPGAHANGPHPERRSRVRAAAVVRSGDAVVLVERIADPAERIGRRQGAVVGEPADWWGVCGSPAPHPPAVTTLRAERLTERTEHPYATRSRGWCLFVASEGCRSGW